MAGFCGDAYEVQHDVPVRNVSLVLYCEVDFRVHSLLFSCTHITRGFGRGRPSHIPGFIDDARRCNTHDYVHVHVAHPCMSDLRVLKHSSSNFARARKVKGALRLFEEEMQTLNFNFYNIDKVIIQTH